MPEDDSSRPFEHSKNRRAVIVDLLWRPWAFYYPSSAKIGWMSKKKNRYGKRRKRKKEEEEEEEGEEGGEEGLKIQ